jgi:hypothetical protein
MSPINHAEFEWILDPRTGVRIRKSAIAAYKDIGSGSLVWVEGGDEAFSLSLDVHSLDRLLNTITCDE